MVGSSRDLSEAEVGVVADASAASAIAALQVADYDAAIVAAGDTKLIGDSSDNDDPKQMTVVSGEVRQTKVKVVSAGSGTGTIPDDDTTPVVTEGDELWTNTITLESTANDVLFQGTLVLSKQAGQTVVVGFFRGSTCIGALTQKMATNSQGDNWPFTLLDSPVSVSELTYSIRIGTSAGTHFWGRIDTARMNGELAKHVVILQELVG